jgi:hypothetical protein
MPQNLFETTSFKNAREVKIRARHNTKDTPKEPSTRDRYKSAGGCLESERIPSIDRGSPFVMFFCVIDAHLESYFSY